MPQPKTKPKTVKPKAKAKAQPTTGDGKVVVAFLHGIDISAHFSESLVNLLAHESSKHRIGARIQKYSGVNVSHGRNQLVQLFLDDCPHEWLLTLDADVVFGPDLLDRLLASADPVERPVMAGLYFGQSEGRLWPQLYQFLDDPEKPSGVQTVRLGEYPKGLVQVIGTGAGCMLIHRSVLEQMRDEEFDPAFPWYQETSYVNEAVTGEDITFCLRVQKLGHPVFVDTRIVCGHVKPMVLDEDLFEAIRAHRGDDPESVTVNVDSLPAPV